MPPQQGGEKRGGRWVLEGEDAFAAREKKNSSPLEERAFRYGKRKVETNTLGSCVKKEKSAVLHRRVKASLPQQKGEGKGSRRLAGTC